LVSCITLLIKPFCLDNVIRAGLSGSFAPYPFSVLAGHYDDEGVISLWQRVVNVIQSEHRALSQKTMGFETVSCAHTTFRLQYGGWRLLTGWRFRDIRSLAWRPAHVKPTHIV
jgi:hypothetical protein